MKVKTLLYYFIFVVMMSLSSCDNNAIFDESVVIPNASWDNKKSPYFDVTIDDTLSNHIFSLNIRHLENYRYSNIYVFLHTTFPNGNQTHDTIECLLSYPDGRWMGKGSGSMRSCNIILNRNLRFPLKGTYHFEIEQAMRDNILNGITDIGLRIEKDI